jgi:hypothetical protein
MHRYEFKLQGYSDTQAHLDALTADAQTQIQNLPGMDPSSFARQQLDFLRGQRMVVVEAHFDNRASLDTLFGRITTALGRPQYGVQTPPTFMWLKEVDEAGAVVDERDFP